MKPISTFAVLGIMAWATNASAAFTTYNVNLSVPNMTFFGGNLSAKGTITVDTLGNLTTRDITNYSITISSPGFSSTTLTSANSSFFLTTNTILNATATDLTVTLPPPPLSSNAGFGLLNSFDTSDFRFENNPIQSFLEMTNGAAVEPDIGVTILSTSGGTFVVGTAAATPEPSSLVLMATAGIMGLGYFARPKIGVS